MDAIKFPHKPIWVSLTSYPFSRIQPFQKNVLNIKPSTNTMGVEENFLNSLVVFFNQANIANRAVEKKEFKEFCSSICKFVNTTGQDDQFQNFLKKLNGRKISEKKRLWLMKKELFFAIL
jgi:hypothetical protein